MGILFWASILSLFSFVAGYGFFSWRDVRRKQTKGRMGMTSEATAAPPEASLRDPVTNLYNRKHLVNRLEENIARCDRTKERMAVILWDIDGFVSFNNQFGQSEGDRFLSKVSDVIRKCVRVYDESFRSGSDEFCAILVPANETIANEVTERVGQAIAHDLFEPGSEYAARHFSISSGLVFYPGGSDKQPESVLHAAGQALYRSRKAKTVV